MKSINRLYKYVLSFYDDIAMILEFYQLAMFVLPIKNHQKYIHDWTIVNHWLMES